MSGLSTTGATILEDIEVVPEDILLWRSFTQWLGAMGFIVLTVALLPIIGIGGIELFVAEAPGPTSEKLHPRIKDTAKALWKIYLRSEEHTSQLQSRGILTRRLMHK